MYKDFAIPERIKKCSTEEELLELINRYNGTTNVYSSIYWYDILSKDEFGNEIRKAKIDKVCFDIDEDPISAKKLSTYLLEQDLKFKIYHSGRGWHFYVYSVGEGNASNLRIAQLSILHASGANADMHLIGDTSRILRIPNTWNFRSKSYCVPTRVEDIGTVEEIGREQRFLEISYGSKYLDLSTYTEDKFEYIKSDVIANMHINTNIKLIPCIRNAVQKINPNQNERYCIVVYLSNAIRNGRDLKGFDMYTIAEEIFKFFEENCQHWMDWSPRKTMYQIKNIMPKTNIICGCKFLRSKGVCIECIPGGL